VVDYSLATQWEFVRTLIRPPAGASDDDAGPSPMKLPAERTPTRAIFVAGLAGLLAFLAWRRLTGPASRRHPAAGFLVEVERKLDGLQVRRGEGEDLEALSHRLRLEHHRLAEPVGRAARRYLEARFGQRPLSKDERRSLLAALEPPRRTQKVS
jgi:hypothetical protein